MRKREGLVGRNPLRGRPISLAGGRLFRTFLVDEVALRVHRRKDGVQAVAAVHIGHAHLRHQQVEEGAQNGAHVRRDDAHSPPEVAVQGTVM